MRLAAVLCTMIDQKKFECLAQLAVQWVRTQEEFIFRHGVPLTEGQVRDALQCGVNNPSRIRILVVDRIPLPDDEELTAAGRRAQIITEASRAVTVGHGIFIRADCWHDRELLLHQLVHVAQCERSGGVERYIGEYLCDRRTCSDFSLGSFEDEARGMAREIYAADKR